jgi:hypothetical protein
MLEGLCADRRSLREGVLRRVAALDGCTAAETSPGAEDPPRASASWHKPRHHTMSRTFC